MACSESVSQTGLLHSGPAQGSQLQKDGFISQEIKPSSWLSRTAGTGTISPQSKSLLTDTPRHLKRKVPEHLTSEAVKEKKP